MSDERDDREPIAPGDARYYEPQLMPPDGAEPDRAAEFERAQRATLAARLETKEHQH